MTFPCAGHMVPRFKNPHGSFKVYKDDTHIHLLNSHFEPIWSPYGIVCRALVFYLHDFDIILTYFKHFKTYFEKNMTANEVIMSGTGR